MVNGIYLYELILNLSTVMTIVGVFLYALMTRSPAYAVTRIGYEKTLALREKNKFLNVLFSKGTWVIVNALMFAAMYYSFGAVLSDLPFLANNRYFTVNNYFPLLFFGPLLPLAIMLVLGMDFRDGLDKLTPFVALETGLGKIACFCTGCCYGIEWSGGLYNYHTNRFEFPVQLLECCVCLVLFAVFLVLLSKRKTKGAAYPLYVVVYSATRFLTEFLRGDHAAEWLGMKPYQVLSLVGCVFGGIWLGILFLLEKTHKRFLYDTNLIDFLLERRKEKCSK